MILNVVGARPNFMKMAPVIRSLKKNELPIRIVHTGQHYDSVMSEDILRDLEFPTPDYHLGAGGGSHAIQTAKIMIAFEKICLEIHPSLVIVAGDVNSTLACGLVAAKLNIPVAHVEAGLRSFDKTMPEETNRILTDHISDLLFTSEESGNINLKKEGIDLSKVHFVGNCMIDSLMKYISFAESSEPWKKYGFSGKDYVLVTLHRPSNVDDKENLKGLLDMLNQMGRKIPILFPAHPRTIQKLKKLTNDICVQSVKYLNPLPYIEFIGLMSKAAVVVTDSGGMQEETTFLRTPCITVRDNTERPITVSLGTNILAGTNPEKVLNIFYKIIKRKKNNGEIPALWDGKSGERIVKIICNFLI